MHNISVNGSKSVAENRLHPNHSSRPIIIKTKNKNVWVQPYCCTLFFKHNPASNNTEVNFIELLTINYYDECRFL